MARAKLGGAILFQDALLSPGRRGSRTESQESVPVSLPAIVDSPERRPSLKERPVPPSSQQGLPSIRPQVAQDSYAVQESQALYPTRPTQDRPDRGSRLVRPLRATAAQQKCGYSNMPNWSPSSASVVTPSLSARDCIVESCMLPKLGKLDVNLCRGDVQMAMQHIEDTLREAAANRHKHDTEERKRQRRRAAAWRLKQGDDPRNDQERNSKRAPSRGAQISNAVNRVSRTLPKDDVRKRRSQRRMEVIRRIRKTRQDTSRVQNRDHYEDSERESSPLSHCSADPSRHQPENLSGEEDSNDEDPHQGDDNQRKNHVNQRLENLRKVRKLKRRVERQGRCWTDWQQAFKALSSRERQGLEGAFRYFDSDDSQIISVTDARDCLADLGLWGLDSDERNALSTILESFQADEKRLPWRAGGRRLMDPSETQLLLLAKNPMADSQEVDFYEFCMVLVPMMREKLTELRRNKLMNLFASYGKVESDRLRRSDCIRLAHKFASAVRAPVTEEGMACAEKCFKETVEEVRAEEGRRDHGDSPSASMRFRHDDGLTFTYVEKMIARFLEHGQRLARTREREVKEIRGLDEMTFKMFREIVVWLHESFKDLDSDRKGVLRANEIGLLLREMGLYSKEEQAAAERMMVEANPDSEPCLDFKGFLAVVEALRGFCAVFSLRDQRSWFNRYDTQMTGELTVQEVSDAFEDMARHDKRIKPKSQAEKEIIGFMVQDSDWTGNDVITFDQFVHLSQAIKEKLCCIELEVETKKAREWGFDRLQVFEAFNAFDQLDKDRSGAMDLVEVRQALVLMRLKVSNEDLKKTFTQLDENKNGKLEFIEFLNLIRMIRDEQGIFSQIAKPETAKPDDHS